MERTNRNRNIRLAALFLAIIAIVATLVIRMMVDSNAPVPSSHMPVNRSVALVEAPVLTSVNGHIEYKCPNDGNCTRTGSSEWFSLNTEATTVVLNTFGGTYVAAAYDVHGTEVTITDRVTNNDGTTTLTFNRAVSGRVLLTLNRGNAESSDKYGVR